MTLAERKGSPRRFCGRGLGESCLSDEVVVVGLTGVVGREVADRRRPSNLSLVSVVIVDDGVIVRGLDVGVAWAEEGIGRWIELKD